MGRVYALQERIAKSHRDRVASRDAVKSFNKVSASELADLTPGWDWAAWAEGLGAPDGAFAHVVARQPEALTAIAHEVTNTPVADWQAFFVVDLLESAAPFLSDDFVEVNFDFNGRTLSGTPEIRARWKRGVGLVEGHLGEAAGEMYVARHYPDEARERMQELVTNVLEAFRRRITDMEWMGLETRERALEKLDAFRPKIGHPPTFRDYSDLAIEADDLWGNVKRGNAFENARDLAKLAVRSTVMSG
ncbi:hypothetical protein [Ornithinimicrobium sp. INDO-MA30-4]|uniref:hypothetical protein n=1 Tax=Ornithinimicrobium sp. INDO-MA30-4 TaxID=2908651 RepID=UPI0028831501|nr:hypothetical protein [Ornithinimicrobium sp. INDO-MA30-4]